MNITRFEDHFCKRAQGQIDAYMDSELLVESNLELIEHFRQCEPCSLELVVRRKVRDKLREAARHNAAPLYLETRIRARVRDTHSGRFHGWLAAPVAAMLCLGTFAAWQLAQLRATVRSQETYLRSVQTKVSALMRAGLADHLHCAVFRHYPQNPPAPARLAEEMGPKFRPMIAMARQHVPPGFQLWMAHVCRDNRRNFIHLTFRQNQRVFSLALIRRQDGEAFGSEGLLPALATSGVPIYSAGVQRFQIATFESPKYLVYAISDLPGSDNLNVMVALAPALQTFLQSL